MLENQDFHAMGIEDLELGRNFALRGKEKPTGYFLFSVGILWKGASCRKGPVALLNPFRSAIVAARS